MIQWLQTCAVRKQLWLLRATTNQLRAYCNDVSGKEGDQANYPKLVGLNKRERLFLKSIGHGFRSIERQVDEMLGIGLEAELRPWSGSWFRRAIRWIFPLSRLSYEPEAAKKAREQLPQPSNPES